jgi:hypothetical protein
VIYAGVKNTHLFYLRRMRCSKFSVEGWSKAPLWGSLGTTGKYTKYPVIIPINTKVPAI